MLESLLAWSQSQFRQLRFEPASLALGEEVEKVVGQLQQQASDKSIPVQVDVPAGLWVHADRQMLHLILRNLLSNAIKFSEAGKAVRLETAKSSSFIHVSVKDEGVGLSPESISRLSGRNADGFTSYGTKGEKGTGLGINLCMNCIEMHGGSLLIQSEEGRGSRFTFSLLASAPEKNSGALCSEGLKGCKSALGLS
ncbi:sensor histidine kinase [Pontibacter locisalis]|uniref:histidine kinase n=1 Tax=Pontibacter locisalis TaxID=1719035 RepID=A0ABW5IV43_9BACT